MKIALSLSLLILLVAACGKSEPVWDDLGTQDQDAIRGRAYKECFADLAEAVDKFITDSNQVYVSSDWQRNDSWKHTYTDGTTTIVTKIRVWKNDGATLYLAITDDVTTTAPYFLRVQKTVNEAMVEDLREQICRKYADVTASNGSGSSMTVKREYKTTEAGEYNTIYDSYKFDYSYPAIVATEWNIQRRILKKKSNGDQISDKTWKSTFVRLDGEDDLPTLPSGWATKYCDIYLPPLVATTITDATPLNYVVPYQLGNNDVPPGTTVCNVGTLPAGWVL